MTLVTFISHIFNDFILDNFLTIKNNLLDDQKLIWLTTNKSICKDLEDLSITYLYVDTSTPSTNIYTNNIHIDPNNYNPSLGYLYISAYKKYLDYDYYWFIEYDVRMYSKDPNNSFKSLFEYFDNTNYDVICDHLKHIMSSDTSRQRYQYFLNVQCPKYEIAACNCWNAFFTINRISHKFFNMFVNSNDILTQVFSEIGITTFAKKYNLSLYSLDYNNKFSVENKVHEFLALSNDQLSASCNTGSNSWNTHPFVETKHNLIYHDNTIIHAVKSKEEIPLEHEKYNIYDKNLNIWVCGDCFEIPTELDETIYNKFDLSLPYNRYNVNHFNKLFSEFVMLYYIYANNIYSKYVGIAHYHRFPIAEMIDLNRIETNNSIQIFYFFNDRKFGPINEYRYPDFALIEHQVYEFGGPDMLVDDMVEFLKQDNYFNIDNIVEYTKYKDFITFYMREIFVMKWDMFVEMIQFVERYIKFISNKYEIYNLYGWIEHVRNNVIKYYYEPKLRNYFTTCYQLDRSKFNAIFSENCGYGVSNCWRVYSYMIEMLISIYIALHNNFFVEDSILET